MSHVQSADLKVGRRSKAARACILLVSISTYLIAENAWASIQHIVAARSEWSNCGLLVVFPSLGHSMVQYMLPCACRTARRATHSPQRKPSPHTQGRWSDPSAAAPTRTCSTAACSHAHACACGVRAVCVRCACGVRAVCAVRCSGRAYAVYAACVQQAGKGRSSE